MSANQALDELNFVCDVLRQYINKYFSMELLDSIEKSAIMISPLSEIGTKHIQEVYGARNAINNSRPKKLVEGFDELLSELNQYSKPKLFLTSISTQEHSYTVFISSNHQKLLGILKSNKPNIYESIDLYNTYKSSGLEASKFYFIKKKPMQI